MPVVFQNSTAAARHNALTSDHIGIDKTFGAPALDYYWGTRLRDAERHVRVCDTCQWQKVTRHFHYGTHHHLTYVAG